MSIVAATANFRTNVRRTMERAGVSQNAFAKQIGISQPYLSCLLRGKVDPSLSQCERLAKGLGVPLISLLLDPAEFISPAA